MRIQNIVIAVVAFALVLPFAVWAILCVPLILKSFNEKGLNQKSQAPANR